MPRKGKPPARKKPVRHKQPGSDFLEDHKELGDVLKELGKAAGINKRKSHNPAHFPTNESLRVRRVAAPKMPTAAELYRDTAQPPLGMGRRAPGLEVPVDASNLMPTAAELFALGEEEGLLEPSVTEDRKEYLSPPPSIEPGRPRATEATYDPDTGTLRVVFRNGGTYEYFGVPRQTWRALKTNRSFGQTLDRLVIGTYQFEKVAF